MNILAIGDVVGSVGCAFLRERLPVIKKQYGVDVVIANGENSADGNGILPASARHLYDSGVHIITTGNHSFRRRESYELYDRDETLLRPANYPANAAPGRGMCIYDMGRRQIAVINLQGTAYMDNLRCPFETVDELLKNEDLPKVVLVDFDALATLPRRHFVNGLAEAIKAGLIADPELFALFECEHPEENIERIIYRSLRVKKNVVENDEHEQGQRACLNFGHTIGHGIEAVKGVRGRRTNGLFHGECVALGMLPMIEDKSLVRRTRAIYRTLGLPTRTGVDKNKVLSYMQHDKKSAGSTITVIKVPGLGCWRADKIPMTELPALLGIKENED